MNKILRLFVCIALIASTLLLSSCGLITLGKFGEGLFPEGYTGGVGYLYGVSQEIYCLETYEETMLAIEKLKSHDSEILRSSLIFSSDGEFFDTKYFIIIGKGRDKIKKGDDPYDRYGGEVSVFCVALYDEISVDELAYDYYYNYHGFEINLSDYRKTYSPDILDLDPTFNKWNSSPVQYSVYYNGESVFKVDYLPPSSDLGEDSIPQEHITAALKSIVFFSE